MNTSYQLTYFQTLPDYILKETSGMGNFSMIWRLTQQQVNPTIIFYHYKKIKPFTSINVSRPNFMLRFTKDLKLI